MRYLSLCSGIEAASVAWEPLGWKPVAFAEIEAFPSAVLAHHYPDVPNLGDITKFQEWPDLAVDLVCGGTPCQSFSVAGLRKGLADPRGNLSLTFLAIVDRYRPRYVLWENVPGVLSTTSHDAPDPLPPPAPLDMGCDGQEVDTEDEYTSEELHAFNSFLAGLSGLGYGVCARVLDAQYTRVDGLGRAVPQRRRRVFVVGYLGDWRRAAAVLSEPAGVLGDSPPRREARERIAGATERRLGSGSQIVPDISVTLTARDYKGPLPEADLSTVVAHHVADSQTVGANQTTGFVGDVVAHSLRAEGFDASEEGTGRGTPLVPVSIHADAIGRSGDVVNSTRAPGMGIIDDGSAYTVMANKPHAVATPVAFDARQSDTVIYGERAGPLDTDGHSQAVAFAQNSRDEVRLQNGDGQIVGALAAEPGMKQTTYVAQPAVAFTMRGREDGAVPEVEHGGVAPVVRTPGGGSSHTFVGQGWAVRRLTPTECERLQGFPDGYTAIPYRGKPAADGPRYNALGNSWAVNCARWIGRRIQMVERIAAELEREAAA